MKKVLAQRGDMFLMHWEENTCTPFVVCTAWDGESWNWGHYFKDVVHAALYLEERWNPKKVEPCVVIHMKGDKEPDGWDYPFEEVDYLLERAIEEERERHFVLDNGRLFEMKED